MKIIYSTILFLVFCISLFAQQLSGPINHNIDGIVYTNNVVVTNTVPESLSLNKVGDAALIPSNTLDETTGSASLWVRYVAAGSFGVLLDDINIGYFQFFDNGAAVYFRPGLGSNYAIATPSGFSGTLNTWINYVAVWNNMAGYMEIFTNGVTGAIMTGGEHFSNPTHTVSLGMNRGSPDSYLRGDIDEVVFWNRCLTTAEVSQVWNNGSAVYAKTNTAPYDHGVTVIYHMDGGNNLLDSSGYGNHGSFVGTPTWDGVNYVAPISD